MILCRFLYQYHILLLYVVAQEGSIFCGMILCNLFFFDKIVFTLIEPVPFGGSFRIKMCAFKNGSYIKHGDQIENISLKLQISLRIMAILFQDFLIWYFFCLLTHSVLLALALNNGKHVFLRL